MAQQLTHGEPQGGGYWFHTRMSPALLPAPKRRRMALVRAPSSSRSGDIPAVLNIRLSEAVASVTVIRVQPVKLGLILVRRGSE
jgi:hypothetical protein